MAPWVALALATLAHALGSFSALAVAPLSPFLVDALQLTPDSGRFPAPAAYLGGVAMSFPAGWMTDRAGVRTTLVAGLAVIGRDGRARVARGRAGRRSSAAWSSPASASASSTPRPGKAVLDWFPPRRAAWRWGSSRRGSRSAACWARSRCRRSPRRATGVTRSWSPASRPSRARSSWRSPIRGSPSRAPRSLVTADGSATLPQFLRRPGVLVVLACGFALSMTQSSLLAYLTLYGREVLGLTAVEARACSRSRRSAARRVGSRGGW